MDESALQTRIDFAISEAKNLQATLSSLIHTFANVKSVISELVSQGLTFLDADTLASLRSYEERLATLCVEAVPFQGVLETTFTKPVMDTPVQRIDPESDQALIIRELLKAAHVVADATEEIAKTTSGDERQHYTGELLSAGMIIQNLLSPLLMAERGEAN